MAGSGVRYSSRALANIVLVVAPEAMSIGREAQVKLQAWGVCSSTDQVGRSGAGAKHYREFLDAQSSERAVYPRGSSGLRVAYRAASSAGRVGHAPHATASSVPFQHEWAEPYVPRMNSRCVAMQPPSPPMVALLLR